MSHRPRRGSMGFWHRKRASRIYPRIKSWPRIKDVKPVAFAGYKVGMTHIFIKDNRKTSVTKGEEICVPVTVIEVPPLKVAGIRLYKLTYEGYKTLTEVWSPNTDSRIRRKISTWNVKDFENKISKIENELLNEASLIKLIVHTQPWLAGIGKKTPEVFEIPMGGEKIDEIWKFSKEVLGKELKVTDVFSEGEQVDVIAVTKGKGFEGEVKRFGVKIAPKAHKDDRRARGAKSKGAWGYHRILPTTPMPGQMGYHRRTEYNKWLLKVSDNPEEINPASGWPGYGIVRTSWIALKGSVPGTPKRLIILRKAIRPNVKIPSEAPEITYISLAAKN